MGSNFDINWKVEDDSRWRRRIFDTFFSLYFTASILILVGYFLQFLPNPLDAQYIKQTFMLNLSDFHPEAPERAAYTAIVFLFPILFCLFYWAVGKMQIKDTVITFCGFFMPLSLICELTVFCSVNLANPYILDYSYLSDSPMLAVAAVSILFSAVFLYQKACAKAVKTADWVCLAICAAGALYTAKLFVTPSYAYSLENFYNFDAYYYPVFEVFHGKPLAVGYNNNYGFYPYLLAPLLRLTGNISIHRFSILMAGLVLIVLLSFLAVLWMNLQNKIIAAAGYFALTFFAFILPLCITNGYYLAYQPHRLLFPSLILLNASLYLHAEKQKWIRIWFVCGFILASLSLIWNLETGVVVTGAWCLFLLYNSALNYTFREAAFYRQSLLYILLTAASAVMAYLFVASVTFCLSGVWLSAAKCFFVQSVFYGMGFYMLPMPSWHPWVVLGMLYAVGLVISLRNMKALNRGNTPVLRSRSALYFILSVVGAGIFSYYQGRSHDKVFTAVIWPGAIIAVLLLQDCYEKAMHTREGDSLQGRLIHLSGMLKYVLLLVVLGSFAASFFYSVQANTNLLALQDTASYPYQTQVDATFATLQTAAEGQTSVDLLIDQPDYYYTQLKMKNPTDLNSNVDWFRRSDYDRALDWLDKTQDLVILDQNMIDRLSNYDAARFNGILASRFTMKQVSETLFVCTLK